MRHYLVIGFVMNFILVLFAYKVWGLLLILGLSLGIYKFMSTKFPSKSAMNEKLMFGSSYVLGCFAAQSLFGDPNITFVVTLIEIVFFIIFASI